MHAYFEEESEKFQKGYKKVIDRRKEWSKFEKWALNSIDKYKQEALKTQKNYLYVMSQTDTRGLKTINQSFIQLYTGARMTGISKETTGKGNGFNGYGIMEEGGRLSISQDPKGGVFFIVYPSKSEVYAQEDKYVVLRHFESPSKIKWDDLAEAIEFYIRYSRYTSIYSEPTIYDQVELWWIKFKFTSAISSIFRGATFGMKMLMTAKTGMPL